VKGIGFSTHGLVQTDTLISNLLVAISAVLNVIFSLTSNVFWIISLLLATDLVISVFAH